MCLQIFTLGLILIVTQTQAIKNVRVSSDSSNLFVDRSSEVLCSYITWKQEQFYGVKWIVEYSGVEATILEYSSDGTVETPTRTFVQADPESATEKRVELRIEHGSEPEDEVTICCEVKVLKDSGYGNMRALKKKHCSEFNVVTEPQRPLAVSVYSSHTSASVGDSVDLTCKPRDEVSPRPDVVILVNGNEVGTNRHTLLVTEDHFDSVERSWGGYRNKNSGSIKVDCEGRYGRLVAANASLTIERTSRNPKRFGTFDNQDYGYEKHAKTSQGLSRQHRQNIGDEGGSQFILVESSRGQGSVILGPLPSHVQGDIPRVTSNKRERLESSANAVTVLNTLGHHGWRVVSQSSNLENNIVWTMVH